jgi:TetR/AcrR family transcriptional regulator, transcriptional repressor for nem operon
MAARDPKATRQVILQAGQEEVYLHGFHGASLDSIVNRAGVTKGAFFHHFPTKTDFGYHIVDELLAAMIAAQWVIPLRAVTDPLQVIAAEFEKGAEFLGRQRLILGCPLNNLAQEMNPLDDGFRTRTSAVFDMWRASFRSALEHGQRTSVIRADIDTASSAHALVAQIEGILSLARNSQDPADLTIGARGLRTHLESLRAAG